jgi:hypothetical protein
MVSASNNSAPAVSEGYRLIVFLLGYGYEQIVLL